jgi:hypothetical protein
MMVPRHYISRISAWLAAEGFTIVTAPASLVAQALKATGAAGSL